MKQYWGPCAGSYTSSDGEEITAVALFTTLFSLFVTIVAIQASNLQDEPSTMRRICCGQQAASEGLRGCGAGVAAGCEGPGRVHAAVLRGRMESCRGGAAAGRARLSILGAL